MTSRTSLSACTANCRSFQREKVLLFNPALHVCEETHEFWLNDFVHLSTRALMRWHWGSGWRETCKLLSLRATPWPRPHPRFNDGMHLMKMCRRSLVRCSFFLISFKIASFPVEQDRPYRHISARFGRISPQTRLMHISCHLQMHPYLSFARIAVIA